MSVVYVVHDDGRHNLHDATRYGETRIIFTKDLYPDNANEMAPTAVRRAYEMLRHFNPEEDYLCLVGAPFYAAMCGYVLGDLAMAPVKLLRFDRPEAKYYEIIIR